jgi:hypothetical protein
MKYLKSYKLFESRFVEFREVISTIKDICQEFEDNNCKCEIEPKDDIQLNIVSLKNRGHLRSIKMNFYLDIDIDRRIQTDEKRSGLGPFPEWFIDTCKRIEDFMLSEGFKTLPSIKYPTEWENFDNIDELKYAMGFINTVRLKFEPTAKPLDESTKPDYDSDWKKPGNPIREMLEVDLREILLEITDLGYRPQLSGFTKGISENIPYVWISNHRRLPHDEFWNEITDTVERVKDYLTDKEFKVSQTILNEGSRHEQVYIYFNI